ncbi:MAG: SpoIIE family protein phosphatase [Flavobacteriales bacterium]|nr:SpoIIE family protein phosphatase [Flavobacteriales bacterium]
MKLRFTIGRKIGTGFGILILLTLVVFILTQDNLIRARSINKQINELYNPSVAQLGELKLLVVESKMYIMKWVYLATLDNSPEKTSLREIISKKYPEVKTRIQILSEDWHGDQQKKMENLFEQIDQLFELHQEVMKALNSFDDYEDPMTLFTYSSSVDEGDINTLTQDILFDLDHSILLQKKNTEKVSEDMIHSFDVLEMFVRYLGLALIIGGVFIAFFTIISIVKPIQELRAVLVSMGKGIWPDEDIKKREDEIGEMTEALNNLVHGMKRTTKFSSEVGSGNFEFPYKPLSEYDTLGKALLKMRDDLWENERILEEKVRLRTEEVVRQKEEIEMQSEILKDLFKQVNDSIDYAKRIQEAILPNQDEINNIYEESFILFKPRDKVSGDFYWFAELGTKFVFAAADCTGHGVPGAFMSMICVTLLDQVVVQKGITDPAKALVGVDEGVKHALSSHQSGEMEANDGMDVSLCCLDSETKILEYSGAYNPLWIIRDGELLETKANKFAIGGYYQGQKKFDRNEIQLQSGDAIYIFSDGFADQFGGPKGKKFMTKRFKQLLKDSQDLSMKGQREKLNTTIEAWRTENEVLDQVDDILVLGLKVP